MSLEPIGWLYGAEDLEGIADYSGFTHDRILLRGKIKVKGLDKVFSAWLNSPMENKPLKIEIVPIDSVVPDPANARRHDEKNILAIKGSLARFGQQKPIVITMDNVIRAGNGTWQAAKELGWKDINVIRSNLIGAEAVGFAIADNRSSELGSWEESILLAQLESIVDSEIDVSQLGWSEKDIAALDSGLDALPPGFKEIDESIKTDFKCPKCGYEWSGKENNDVHTGT